MRDRTARWARHRVVRDALRPGEEVLAAVALQLPGTNAAAMAGAGSAARTGTVSSTADERSPLARAKQEAAEGYGIRGFRFVLVLTDGRVLLLRKSVFGRVKDVTLDVAAGDLEGVRTSKQGGAVWLDFTDGRKLRLETPKAFKFLPPVYEQLPERFAAARR